MKTELSSLSKLFSHVILRIPDYQRGYSWTSKHLTDFWNDIQQLEEGKNHYTGVLTLENVPHEVQNRWDDDLWIIRSKNYQPYYVVDGQQRITTALILIQAILEQMKEKQVLNYFTKDEIKKQYIFESKDGGISRSYVFGYEKDNPSYEFLKMSIFNEQSDRHSTAEETIYTHNLRTAKNFFAEKLQALSLGQIENSFQKLTQRLLFNIYAISDDIDVCVAFETMNNRGKPLSALELLKNRLIYLSTRLNVELTEKDRLRSAINECWKTVYHYLGKNKNCPLDDDDFLRRHFFLYFSLRDHASLVTLEHNDKKSSEESIRYDMIVNHSRYHDDRAKELLLDNIFTVRHVDQDLSTRTHKLSLDNINEFSLSIKHNVRIYYQLFNPQDANLEKEEATLLEQHYRLGEDYNMQFIMALYTWPERIVSTATRMQILRLLEQFRFIRKLLSRDALNSSSLDTLQLAHKLINKDISPAGVLTQLKSAAKAILKLISSPSEIGHWARKPLGYYGWTGIRYFLYEYEQKLMLQSKTNRVKLRWENFLPLSQRGLSLESWSPNYDSIEHIYPQKVSHDSWKTAFGRYSVKQRNVLKQSLGNLLPLSNPKNSSLSNKSFQEKRGTADNRVGYAYGSYSENEIALLSDWTAEEIRNRGVRLLEFMEERWGVHFGDRNTKIKILSLDFVPDGTTPGKRRASLAKAGKGRG